MLKTKSVVAGALLAAVLSSASIVSAQPFPENIPLPNGFRPEGIASGAGTDFYVGSLANGAIYRGDVRTGEGGILYAGAPGRVTVGIKFDNRTGSIFAAGGGTGMAYVYDARTGAELASYTLAPGFINDVIITNDAAYFTNSQRAELYKLPLRGNRLPAQSDVQVLPLSGDWQQVTGFNANGIAATPNGKTLIVVNSTTGFLYNVDPNTGVARMIDLGGQTVTQGDGILLDGKTLYVLRNRSNVIVVIRLNNDYTAGEVTGTITSPLFRVPTTLAEFGNALYAVNARFGEANPDAIDYNVVRVSK